MMENPESEPEQLPLRILPAGPDASVLHAYEMVEADSQDAFAAYRRHLEATTAMSRWLADRKEEEPTVNPLALL